MTSSNEPSQSGEPEEPEEPQMEEKDGKCRNCAFCAKGVVFAIFFYLCLALVIYWSRQSQDVAGILTFIVNTMVLDKMAAFVFFPDPTPKTAFSHGNTTCGGDSFMLRDGVCDEATNTRVCQFDGGDCCQQIKVRTLCKNCSCILFIDQSKVEQQFIEFDIKPFKDPAKVDSAIEDWVTEVADVISAQVCAVLCLDHNQADNINAWRYNGIDNNCQCGWIRSSPCPMLIIDPKWTFGKLSDLTFTKATFVQLEKIIPCGKKYLAEILFRSMDKCEFICLRE